MKQIAASIIILLLVFNWVGYGIVVNIMQQKSDIVLEKSLDKKGYKEEELMELKIPLHLPYQNSWASFERFDGEVNLDGVLYKYVKRKLANDTLYLLCLPNTKKMMLETAKNNFYKDVNDLSKKNNSKKSGAVSKNITADFAHIFSFVKLQEQFNFSIKEIIVYKENCSPNNMHLSPEQPPDFLSV